MFNKKLVPFFLAGCLIATGIPAVVYGENARNSNDIAAITIPAGEIAGTGNTSGEPKAEDLKRIIETVKSKLTVPEEYSVFDYNFNGANYYGGATWDLNWYTSDNSKRILVQSDQEGNIIGFNSYNDNSGNYTPKYMKADLKPSADKFIKKISGDIAGEIQYISAASSGTGRGQYNYQYQRVVNGIPMPDNMVTVGVNYETGKVTSYSANWLYHAEIPSAAVKITKEEAAKKIGKSVKMKLSYQNAYTTDKNGKTKIKAFLVYEPDSPYAAVDAKTGEVYTSQNEWIEKASMDDASGTAFGSSKEADRGELTEEEISKIEEINKLISKEAAIKAVTGNNSLLLDKNLKSITADLYKKKSYTGGEESYIWRIHMRDPREVKDNDKDNYRAYANAAVDAVSGKILSFNASVKDYYNMTQKEWESVKVKYSKEQSQKILENFLKAQIPDKFNRSVLSDNKESYVIAYEDGKEIYGGYYYNYNRVNEGIEYSYNGINGSVDGVTGKIYSFFYDWNDTITFEAPKNIISADRALDIYLSNKDFHLVYEINNIHSISAADKIVKNTDAYSVQNEVRLVYRTDINPASLSPFTGKQLDHNGDEYVDPNDRYQYKDLDGTASKRSIRLLSELGIGFKGGEFKPDQAITEEELTDLLSQAGIYYDNRYKLSNNAAAITRTEAAKFAIKVLGYESIAKLKGIYNIDFADQDRISAEDFGYVALAQGLNLVTASSNHEFRPGDKLTRAEAADLLVAMLSVER